MGRAKATEQGPPKVTLVAANRQLPQKKLLLTYNTLTDVDAKYLADALKNGKPEVSNVSHTGITAKGAKHFSVAGQCQLKELHLVGNKLGDEGAKYLADTLVNSKLKVLKVDSAGITAKGAKHFSTALKSGQCQLTELHLDDNRLGDKGAVYLADALENFELEVFSVR